MEETRREVRVARECRHTLYMMRVLHVCKFASLEDWQIGRLAEQPHVEKAVPYF